MKRLAVILLVVLSVAVILPGCGSSVVGTYKEVGGVGVKTTLVLRANKSFSFDFDSEYDGDYRVDLGYVILDPSDSGPSWPSTLDQQLKILENERLLLEWEHVPPMPPESYTYVKVD